METLMLYIKTGQALTHKMECLNFPSLNPVIPQID